MRYIILPAKWRRFVSAITLCVCACIKKRNRSNVHAKISGWARDPLQTCGFLVSAPFLLLTAGVSGSLSVVDLVLKFPVASFWSWNSPNLDSFRNYVSCLVLKLQFPSLPVSSPPCASEIGKKYKINLKSWVSLLVTWLFPQYFSSTQVLSSSCESPYHGVRPFSHLGSGLWLIKAAIGKPKIFF